MLEKNKQLLLEQSKLPDNHPLENVHWELYKIFDKSVVIDYTNSTICVYHGGLLDKQITEIKNFTRFVIARLKKTSLVKLLEVYYADPETGEDKALYIDEEGNVFFLDKPSSSTLLLGLGYTHCLRKKYLTYFEYTTNPE